ncbi:MAG: PQQ-dependent sugar dehydrogenase [Chthonomonas sp.]|nr:PQQ-dependent sugar dehydrogenase [Chthonomonas sp.]
MIKWITAFASIAVGCTAIPSSDQEVAQTNSAPEAELVAFAQNSSVSGIYDRTCAKCHGDRGQGGGGGTQSLNTTEKFHQKYDRPYFDAIKNGVKDMGMEAYAETLTDQQIWGLVVHIRELQYEAYRRENGGPKAKDGVYQAQGHSYKVTTVLPRGGGLSTPWGIDWLPDGRSLITNKAGTILVTREDRILGSVSGLPTVAVIGQGGLMDVAVHPKYRENGWIYLSYSDPGQRSGTAFTKIVRGKLKWTGSDAEWTEQQTIYQAPQEMYSGGGVHFGNRTVFDGKGHIYVCYGERGQGNLSQDLTKTNGKILRLKEDGTIPADNPFVNSPGAVKAIWSYGHRNPQGLVMGLDGVLWDTEHGPRGGDELNKVVKGGNYGWPLVAFSINYNDAPLATPWPSASQKFVQPEMRWLPSIAACGLDVIRGGAFPQWRGDLIAGGLAGQTVRRIRVKDGKYVDQEELIWNMGRVRDVAVHPLTGEIYVLLNQPDTVVKISRAN